MVSETKQKEMGSDVIAEIERGRKVGYSDALIKKSLEIEGYSDDSIKQAYRQIENKKKNGMFFVFTDANDSSKFTFA